MGEVVSKIDQAAEVMEGIGSMLVRLGIVPDDNHELVFRADCLFNDLNQLASDIEERED
jgi:hypothetical protein